MTALPLRGRSGRRVRPARLERALLDQLTASPVEAAPRSEEVMRPVGSVVDRRPRLFAVLAAVVVGVVVVAAVAFAGVTLLDSEGEDGGPVTAGARPPGIVLPLAQIQASDLGLDLPGGANTSIGAVAVAGPGLVAVGSDDYDAAVWTSADGRNWSRVPDDEAVFGGPSYQAMRDVVVGGPGLVAVGRDSVVVGKYSYAVAAVWTSPDGITWSHVPHEPAVFGRATGEADDIFRMKAVATGGPGLVAIGERGGELDQATVSGGLIAKSRRRRRCGRRSTGSPGHAFRTTPPSSASGTIRQSGVSASLHDIVLGGPGLVVVGDIFRGASNSFNGAVWTSPDGLRWTLAAETERGTMIQAVTEGGPGLVAGGMEHGDGLDPATADAAVWTSPDGSTWSKVPPQPDVLGGPAFQVMTSVAAGGPGLVAATGSDAGRSDGRLSVWTSVDGITWSQNSDYAFRDSGEPRSRRSSASTGSHGSARDEQLAPSPWAKSSALGGIRTPNLLIRSQMLYPLSYERWDGQVYATTVGESEGLRRRPL